MNNNSISTDSRERLFRVSLRVLLNNLTTKFNGFTIAAIWIWQLKS